MKQLLTILFCIVCFNCFGQIRNIDSILNRMDSLGISTTHSDTPYFIGGVILATTGGYEIPFTPKYDTVEVMMLMCNTDKKSMTTVSALKFTWWDYGYSVRKEDIEYGNYFNGQGGKNYTTWEHLYYIDSDYKPLSKSIIVWMAKEL